LYRVTVNVVLMHRRSLRSRPSFASDADDYEAVDAGPLPDEHAARNSRVRAFYRLLDKLSEKKRTVFVLHEVEGLSPAQISELVSAPVLTVRTRLFYARREVVQLLADEPELRLLSLTQLARGDNQRSTEEPA
jgi:RNA polymerase sigma-70 factor (ECF subfamily)